jgi:8-oxo-dGTP pyrophosphatase MutT (NUDIX family)
MDDTQPGGANLDGPPRPQVAAVVLLRADGAALLQHRDDKPGLPRAGMWVPPGGHLDPGEAPLAAAFREFYEETAYRCRRLRWLGSFLDDPGDGHRVQFLHVFWDAYDGLQALRCLEGQALEFIRRDEATRYALPDFVLPVWDRALAAYSYTTLANQGIGQ